jgi:D-threo-aldose 1-dehydrogenase
MAAKQMFKTRQVGRTKLQIPELGFGTATLGGQLGLLVSDDAARATGNAVFDAGIGYFDTAPHYGFGRAEHITGDVLRFRQDGSVLSTKVGRLLKPVPHESQRKAPQPWTQPYPFEIVYDYTYDGIMRSFEDSLQRLGLGRIDIVLVHDIGVQSHGIEQNAVYWQQLATGGYRALDQLRSQGVISAIGLGVNEIEVLIDAFAIGDWDVHLLAGRYTLLEQQSLSPLLSTCLTRGTSVIAAGPFNAGVLAGADIWGPNTGVYGKVPEDIKRRVAAFKLVCDEFNVPLGAAALQFALAHKAVCNVLTGPKSPEEIDGILAWWNTQIPDGFWNALADKKLVAEGTPLPNGRTA